tara:strand:+ start:13146 stop:14486 length:1341 start_codon:yes stop_codon:yes gene_type:complete
MRNTYFTHGTRNEQFLLQNIVEEHLKMFGMDVLYCPRKLIQKDGVFNEEVISEFDDSYIIEAYLENPEGFGGSGDLLTKFGIRQTDEITMVISQQRFSDFISQFLMLDKGKTIEVAERPQEGDLIYFPITCNYFEIKFVEHEEPFYQLGKGYVYKLKCELFEYSDEQGDLFEDDEALVDYGYTVKHYYLPTNGVTATGTVVLDGDEVEQIYISANGSKYNETPTITISGDGTGATAAAYLVNITVDGGSPVTPAVIRSTVKEGEIRSVNIVDGGSGYDQDRATLAITSPDTGGVPATLTPTFTNGVLTSINILSGGSEYKSVKVIDITNRGSGYTAATAAFTAAPAGLTGTFTVPEQVTGGTTGAVAQLVDWNAQEGWIQLKNPTATFSIGELIMGATSGATMVLDSRNEMLTVDTKYSESVTFETQADDIIDFSEGNPFGMAGNL